MPGFDVRPITEDERRSTFDLLRRALHSRRVTDELWARVGESWPAAGKIGAFDERGTPVGIVSSFGTEIAVPGGRTLPAAAVDGAGVRADRTRRGVLSALMAAQLADFAARGLPLAVLHASEPTIYGRFGYGSAALGKTLRVVRPAARLHERVAAGGDVRLLTPEEAVRELPALYRRIGLHRPGMLGRPPLWWPIAHDRHVDPDAHLVAVHSGTDGDDGFVVYATISRRSVDSPDHGAVLDVHDLHAAGPAARAALWRFLLSVDLVSEVRARHRPVDEPLALMLTDHRHAATVSVEDDLWLRPVDVAAALAARSYRAADPVVVAVTDRLLPANTGHYEIGPDGGGRTAAAADLVLDVDTLGMLYLGQWSATTLAEAGRIDVRDPAAPGRADELFTTTAAPWCGTSF
ncbi:GNAT family N-acetyltransferase [Amycolatopsis sp. cmx-4-61]|uniref:GNAT family N-acetyltransferase n=1 Tax=Amycolatopsis sp. cmx-4-61 TaxID=2790937 RepID=UPI00397B731F